MPRPASNSSIAASLAPVKGWRPEPPDRLGDVGRALWIEIVDSRPAGFFQPVDLPTLEEVCHWEEIARKLHGLPTDDHLVKTLATARTQQRNALRSLRLTKQATVRAEKRDAGEVKTRPWKRGA